MELQTLLDQYEKLIVSAMVIQISDSIRDIREKRVWNAFKFLINCGVEKAVLLKIEEKHNY